jgi:hypothetical protein
MQASPLHSWARGSLYPGYSHTHSFQVTFESFLVYTLPSVLSLEYAVDGALSSYLIKLVTAVPGLTISFDAPSTSQ